MDAAVPKGAVVHGTCGWGGAAQQLSVYPASCRSAEERMRVYVRHFGVVEVDSSCYALPAPAVVQRWVDAARGGGAGFRFVFKALGALCAPSARAAYPQQTQALIPPTEGRLAFTELPEAAKADVFSRLHASLEPARAAGLLAGVLFQFHVSFVPSERAWAHVFELRQRLDASVVLAVEFRARAWLTDATVERLREHGLVLVASDDLEHEMAQPDRAQSGLPPGQRRVVMPTRLESTGPFALVRVHRRHGTRERILGEGEIASWVSRIRAVAPSLRGPCYVLWGTDWADAPLVNSRALSAGLPEELRLDWAASLKRQEADPKRGGVAALFARAAERGATTRATPDAPPPASKRPAPGRPTAGPSSKKQRGTITNLFAKAASKEGAS